MRECADKLILNYARMIEKWLVFFIARCDGNLRCRIFLFDRIVFGSLPGGRRFFMARQRC